MGYWLINKTSRWKDVAIKAKYVSIDRSIKNEMKPDPNNKGFEKGITEIFFLQLNCKTPDK